MNLRRLYDRFIADRLGKAPTGYSEVHHIIPRCDGGTDDPSNLARLSTRDHIFAHYILAKWKGGKHWAAVEFIFGNNRNPTAQEIRLAAKARGRFQQSPEFRSFMSSVHKGKVESTETRRKKAEANRRRKYKPHTEETKAKIAASVQGFRHTKEARAKISRALQGRKLSTEHITRMAEANRGKKRSEETKARLRAAWVRRKAQTTTTTTQGIEE